LLLGSNLQFRNEWPVNDPEAQEQRKLKYCRLFKYDADSTIFVDAVRKLELLQEFETTATLIVKGNDGRLDEDSI
jgi:hypothetical protein